VTSGTLTIGGSANANSTFNGLISLNNNVTISQQVSTTGSNALNINGGVTNASGLSHTVTFSGSGAMTVGGNGMSDGTGQLFVNVNSATTFNAPNTYTGDTNVNSATLKLTGPGTGAVSRL